MTLRSIRSQIYLLLAWYRFTISANGWPIETIGFSSFEVVSEVDLFLPLLLLYVSFARFVWILKQLILTSLWDWMMNVSLSYRSLFLADNSGSITVRRMYFLTWALQRYREVFSKALRCWSRRLGPVNFAESAALCLRCLAEFAQVKTTLVKRLLCICSKLLRLYREKLEVHFAVITVL